VEVNISLVPEVSSKHNVTLEFAWVLVQEILHGLRDVITKFLLVSFSGASSRQYSVSHIIEQPSLSRVFLSSHSSPISIIPLPQSGLSQTSQIPSLSVSA